MIRALALCLAAATPAAAEVAPGAARSVTQGVHCRVETLESRPAEGTIAGSIDTYAETPPLRWLTATVPAARGVSFGLHVVVPPAFAGQVRFEVEHPPMGPDGVTVETWTSVVPPDDTHYTGFHFEHDYELVTGPWILRGWSGGTMLYEARFDVVAPELRPDIVSACLGPDMLS